MTAPDKLYLSAPNGDHEYEIWFDDDEGGTPYIRTDLHQSALADRDREIARLQARLDAVRDEIRAAYVQGALDVHHNYQVDAAAEFGEAADDYTANRMEAANGK